jgi:hypothetical protein
LCRKILLPAALHWGPGEGQSSPARYKDNKIISVGNLKKKNKEFSQL